MNFFNNLYSTLVITVFSLLFVVKFSFDVHIDANSKKCIAAYDQFGYYSYLPATFIYDDLYYEGDWVEDNQKQYCGGVDVYQFPRQVQGSGNRLNIYHMGLAYIQLPGFLIADFWSRHSNYKRDGMSFPYQLMVRITALLFVILGLMYLRKTLLLFFSDRIVALTIAILYLSSNLIIGFFWGELMPHLYLFALNSIFVYHVLKYKRTSSFKNLLISALVLAVSSVIRPTQVLWFILPLIINFKSKEYIQLTKLLIYPLLVLVLNIPQLLYWKIIGGEWLLYNLHSESLALTHPYIWEFLFSFRKGWLIYSPIFIFSLIGMYLLYKRNKPVGMACIVFSIVNIYILSSWETWWYAASYGSRVMMDSYVIFSISLGYFLIKIMSFRKKVFTVIIFILISGMVFLNNIQSIQYKRGILPQDRVTADYYWHIFGKINGDFSDQSLLLISRDELNWPDVYRDTSSLGYQYGYSVKEKSISLYNNQLEIVQNSEFQHKIRRKVFDLTPTDEAQIKITIKYDLEKESDVMLNFTFESYEPYYLFYILLEADKNEVTSTFNLPEITHYSDELVTYFWNPNFNKGTIIEIEAKVIYLDRK